MQVHAIAVPRQGDIAAVGVHPWRRKHVGAVDRHALRLVDGRGIAMVDPVIILEVEADGSAIVGLHGHALRVDLPDGPERAVLHAKAALIPQKHDAISAGEVAYAAFDRHTHLVAQIAGGPHPLARCLVECLDLVVVVGENDPALVGRDLPVAVPALDQIAARLLAGLGLMHHAAGAIGVKRSTGFAIGEIARGVPLPVLLLAAHFADFRPAVSFVNRAEGRTRLDGLQLLRIADQHDLGASVGSMGQHAFQLASAPTMPASSMTSTSRVVSRSRPCCQPCSMLVMVRDAMPDPLLRFSAAMPDSATPRTS